jgi:hypothetical protein
MDIQIECVGAILSAALPIAVASLAVCSFGW